jgi:pimeloyl-ACP methyl ester carboxylesterase
VRLFLSDPKALRPWEILLAIAGAISLGASAWTIDRNQLPHRESQITAGRCHMPVTILDPSEKPSGVAILFHGLSADRRIMEDLGSYLSSTRGLRSYLVDLPGHGDNTDRFSFPRADDCARIVVGSLIRSGAIDPERTILVGHSMGGAIAIRAASREAVAATIALSPAPIPTPRRVPANLLVLSAQYDLPILKRGARALAQAAGGERTEPRDFAHGRAFALRVISWSDHTSLLIDPRVFRQAGDWTDRALEIAPRERSDGRPFYLSLAALLGFLGILLLFPFVATATAGAVGRPAPGSPDATLTAPIVLAEGAVSGLATVLILAAFRPLSSLGLYGGDYLASLLLVAGVLLLAWNLRSAMASLDGSPRTLLFAALVGLAFLLGIGAWLNWRTADLWLNAPRWLRFAALLPVAWLFCFAEEVTLGPVGVGCRRALRFFVSVGVRAEFWLACLVAYFAFASGQVLIVVLGPSLGLFSILQRLGTDALRRHTGSAAAAALFGAILAAWFIAAVFPLT